MRKFTVTTDYDRCTDCYFELGKYRGGNIAIQIMSESEGPYATITVNLDTPPTGEGEAFVDVNNCPWSVDLIEQLKIGKYAGKVRQSGFCYYPLFKFDMAALHKYSR